MGKTRNGCLTTEKTAAHPGSSRRTLERYRVRRGGPPCVCCCDRGHELRSDLDGRIAEDERPVSAGPDDDCRRDEQKIAVGENKFSPYRCVYKRRRFISGVRRSTKTRS